MIYVMLIVTNIITLAVCVITIKRLLVLVEKIDEINVQVEESLDIIDASYTSVSKHLESPVLFDDPVVITMIRDIKQSRDAMLLIANKVTEPFQNNDDLDEE